MLRALSLAALSTQRGDFAEAHKLLDEADKIRPNDGRSIAARIQLYELEGKFECIAVRVPTVDVSLVDLTVETEKPAYRKVLFDKP